MYPPQKHPFERDLIEKQCDHWSGYPQVPVNVAWLSPYKLVKLEHQAFGMKLFQNLWRIMLTEIYVWFFLRNLPYVELWQIVQFIYTDQKSDLNFLRILKPVVNNWPHKDSFGRSSEVVKHWFTEKLYFEVSALHRGVVCPNADLQGLLARV
jgi:hypothetical protein